MSTKVKLSTTAKGVFTILLALIIAGVTILGGGVLAKQGSSSAISTVVVHKQQRVSVYQFLIVYIGWEQSPPLLKYGHSNNMLGTMLKDMPEFWKKTEALKESLKKFHSFNDFFDIPACKKQLEYKWNHSTDEQRKWFDDRSIRTPIGKAWENLETLLSQVKTQGTPQMKGNELSIYNIRLFSYFTEKQINALRMASFSMDQNPNDWVCWPENIQPLEEFYTSNSQPPRKDTDGNFSQLLTAFRNDKYSEVILSLSPKEFEKFYDSEEQKFSDEISFAKGLAPLKLFDWMPALPIWQYIKYYPWITAIGMFIIFISLRRLNKAASISNFEIDLEDPGFPQNLVIPPPHLGGINFFDRMIAWGLMYCPAFLSCWMVITQYEKSKEIMNMTNVEYEYGLYRFVNETLSDVALSLTPSFVQVLGVFITILLTFFVIINLNKFIRMS